MYDDILVATDETDVADSPIQYRSTWLARLVDHLVGIVRELVFQPGSQDADGPDAAESVYVPTDNATAYASSSRPGTTPGCTSCLPSTPGRTTRR